jgi:V/A-type H+-transporting ATPase subunit I
VLSIKGIPALLSQIGDAMLVLGLCLGLGVVHIITGLIIGMYMEIKNGNILAAIFDKLSWILAVLGGIAWLVGGIIGTVGMYVFLTGVALIIFTSARNKPGNVIKKFVLGLGAVYGITGYLSDILSYARIFGMGLSTSVIEQVFNTIAGMVMGNVLGYIFGIVILIVGHTFNIVINAMGAFVHTARLQFIEFYSKFYQGDGRAFAPLTVKT